MENLPKISFIFPIYKEGEVLENIKKIIEDPYPNENKEIIIAVDSPTEDFIEKLRLVSNFQNVKILISNERRGKVTASNEAASKATGDILIFIDGDAIIENINLSMIVEELKECDILSPYRRILPNTFVGRMQRIEYIFFYDIIFPLYNFSKRFIFLEGSGIIIKRNVWEKLGGYRKVTIEDFDLGMRAYLNNYKVKLTENLTLILKPVESFKKLWDQRKRWYYGGLEEILYYGIDIFKHIGKYIYVFIPMIILNPALILDLFILFLPFSYIYSAAEALYSFAISSISPAIVLFIYPLYILYFVIYLYGFLLYVIFVALLIEVIMLVKRRKFVNIIDSLLFLLIYEEFNLIVVAYVVLYYILFEKPPKFNWKI